MVATKGGVSAKSMPKKMSVSAHRGEPVSLGITFEMSQVYVSAPLEILLGTAIAVNDGSEQSLVHQCTLISDLGLCRSCR